VLILGVIATNWNKITHNFSVWWHAKVIPLLEAGVIFLLWTIGLPVAIFLLWRAVKATYEYCQTHRIVTNEEYLNLQSEIETMTMQMSDLRNSVSDYKNLFYDTHERLQKAQQVVEKAKTKPKSVVDDIVKDLLRNPE